MPLVWAHAEFIKLASSMALGRPFDRPEAVWKRYEGRRPETPWAHWSLNVRLRRIPSGKRLRICLPRPAMIHWGTDGWHNVADIVTRETGLGIHMVELPTASLQPGQRIDFTFRWSQDCRWQGEDYTVVVRPHGTTGKDGR